MCVDFSQLRPVAVLFLKSRKSAACPETPPCPETPSITLVSILLTGAGEFFFWAHFGLSLWSEMFCARVRMRKSIRTTTPLYLRLLLRNKYISALIILEACANVQLS